MIAPPNITQYSPYFTIYIITEPQHPISPYSPYSYGGFLQWGTRDGLFIMENLIKIDDEMGYPHFRKPPYVILWEIPMLSP